MENINYQLDALKDKIRDVESNYLKKDDLDYRKYKEKVDRNTEDIAQGKNNLRNINIVLDKNNDLTETINLQNTRLTTLLEGLTEKIIESSVQLKTLSEKVNKIDIETSKNTDNRLTTKQIVVSIIISILMLLIGAGLAKSGMK